MKSPRRWQRINQRLASSRLASWFFSHVLYRIDRPLLRLTGGRQSLTSLLSGLQMMTLTTTGAKSGLPRSTPLTGLIDGDQVVLIASNFGRSRHPGWYFNLRANPVARLSIRGQSAEYLAREAEGEERAQLWQRAVKMYPGYEAYKRRAGKRVIPVMVLE